MGAVMEDLNSDGLSCCRFRWIRYLGEHIRLDSGDSRALQGDPLRGHTRREILLRIGRPASEPLLT